MYGIYANIWGILMVNVTIYTIHGSYGKWMIYNGFTKIWMMTGASPMTQMSQGMSGDGAKNEQSGVQGGAPGP